MTEMLTDQLADILGEFCPGPVEKQTYELLKSEYQKRHGESWEDARKSILLKLQKLAEVVADIEGIDKATAEKNLRAQINGFKMDIDGFVTIIKETSLASTFFVGDLMTSYLTVKGQTYLAFESLIIVGVLYFVLTFVLSKLVGAYERRLKQSD